ncbi:hypothetical protein WN55_06094 [Dufourea novaeangliae]|uniref:HAUS augmin-like complex subunit 6 N-terminal domain-containing protein n=1 Tax=Dufourea novaeangliae TaxID=178035 RepID=A0A154P1U4_DUFNO|nr:hypothetical protein WN55_06094 [Dufourea novaeangliae]
MSINVSFYKNVSLLMQMVPPSFKCTKLFNQGMFDRSNTSGFIHISHYLLSIYNLKRFQRNVIWPILTKMDEKTYRIGVKEYLEVIAVENPDINFPPILMTHIFRATGMRFLTIMWKLSLVTLRTYIMKQYEGTLLQAPNAGDTNNLTKTYITNTNLEKESIIFKFYEELQLVLKSFEYYMQNELSALKNLQTDIFEIKKTIEKCIEVAPVSRIIATRLADPMDTEILTLWKTNIDINMQFLHYRNSKLQKFKALSNTVKNTVLSLCSSVEVFDANNLSKVNTEVMQQAFNNNAKISSGLYMNGCLIFYSLLSILNQILKQMESCLKMSNLPDLSYCETTISTYSGMLKSKKEVFEKVLKEVTDLSSQLQSSLHEKSLNYTIERDFFYSICKKVLITWPKLEFCIDEGTDKEKLDNILYLSPQKGKYKSLFKRYKKNVPDSPKKLLLSSSYNNSLQNLTPNWVSPKRHSSIYKSSPNKTKVSPRYSKLFSPKTSRTHFKGNHATSSPIQFKEGETSEKSNSPISHQSVNLEAVIKNIFDLSQQISNVVRFQSKS